MRLNRPLFIIASALLAAAFCLEIGSSFFAARAPTLAELERVVREQNPALDGGQVREQARDLQQARQAQPPRPGLAIPYLPLLDGLLLFSVLLVGLSLLLPERVHGRVQGLATVLVTLCVILLVLLLVPLALALLLLMFGLFVAAPFGTLTYLAIWGFFDRDGAALALSALMALKVAFAVLLVLSHPRFIQNKGLVLLIATSLLANVVVAFLHGLVPGVMVSITDALAAVVVGILAAVWAVLMLVGALISIFKALRIAGRRQRELPGPHGQPPATGQPAR